MMSFGVRIGIGVSTKGFRLPVGLKSVGEWFHLFVHRSLSKRTIAAVIIFVFLERCRM
ncbi:hypothetical protein MITS9509_02572 [Synechococcus sp. MIT S9509]|nr:hypothetical protein MITS9504_02327 [Synechococcus sp. MIT S9504]KZR91343.1 hypothetical protein MITS9509_02572 [Synechococcus sp. MIT S9509]